MTLHQGIQQYSEIQETVTAPSWLFSSVRQHVGFINGMCQLWHHVCFRVVKDYVSCLDKSFMRGCDRQYLDDVKKTAQILQRQYCCKYVFRILPHPSPNNPPPLPSQPPPPNPTPQPHYTCHMKHCQGSGAQWRWLDWMSTYGMARCS